MTNKPVQVVIQTPKEALMGEENLDLVANDMFAQGYEPIGITTVKTEVGELVVTLFRTYLPLEDSKVESEIGDEGAEISDTPTIDLGNGRIVDEDES